MLKKLTKVLIYSGILLSLVLAGCSLDGSSAEEEKGKDKDKADVKKEVKVQKEKSSLEIELTDEGILTIAALQAPPEAAESQSADRSMAGGDNLGYLMEKYSGANGIDLIGLYREYTGNNEIPEDLISIIEKLSSSNQTEQEMQDSSSRSLSWDAYSYLDDYYFPNGKKFKSYASDYLKFFPYDKYVVYTDAKDNKTVMEVPIKFDGLCWAGHLKSLIYPFNYLGKTQGQTEAKMSVAIYGDAGGFRKNVDIPIGWKATVAAYYGDDGRNPYISKITLYIYGTGWKYHAAAVSYRDFYF